MDTSQLQSRSNLRLGKNYLTSDEQSELWRRLQNQIRFNQIKEKIKEKNDEKAEISPIRRTLY